MDAKNPDTIINGRSTLHPEQMTSECSEHAAGVRHARIVVNRLLRSNRRGNDIVQDRILQAASVLNSAKANETAFVEGRPIDVALRIAARLVRRRGR